jgi:beta-N-acetylhexosaminidase
MKKGTGILIILLFVGVLITGANYFFKPFKDSTFLLPKTSPTPSPQAIKLDSIDAILADMTAEQKVAQLLAVPVRFEELASTSAQLQGLDRTSFWEVATASAQASESASLQSLTWLDWITTFHPGVVSIFGSNIPLEAAKNRLGLLKGMYTDQSSRVLIATDHEGGTVQRFTGTGFAKIASWQELCTQDDAFVQEVIASSAAELADVGVNIVYGPVLDYAKNHPHLKSRVCSDNPETVAARAKAAIVGYQDQGMYPVVKHFPGIGKTTKDLHVLFDSVLIEEKDANVYLDVLTVFPDIGVMTSHVGVINQFTEIPCSQSKSCVGQIHDAHPNVIVFSDALEMGSAVGSGQNTQRTLADASYAALLAGNDVLVYGAGVTPLELTEVYRVLFQKYQKEENFRREVDRKVYKILDLKNAFQARDFAAQ